MLQAVTSHGEPNPGIQGKEPAQGPSHFSGIIQTLTGDGAQASSAAGANALALPQRPRPQAPSRASASHAQDQAGTLAKAQAKGQAQARTQAQNRAEAQAQTAAQTQAQAQEAAQTKAQDRAQAQADGDSQASTKAGDQAQSAAQAKAQNQSGAHAEAQAQADTQTHADAHLKADAQTQAATQAQAAAQTQADAQKQVDAQTAAQTQAQAQTTARTLAMTQVQTDVQTKPEAQANALADQPQGGSSGSGGPIQQSTVPPPAVTGLALGSIALAQDGSPKSLSPTSTQGAPLSSANNALPQAKALDGTALPSTLPTLGGLPLGAGLPGGGTQAQTTGQLSGEGVSAGLPGGKSESGIPSAGLPAQGDAAPRTDPSPATDGTASHGAGQEDSPRAPAEGGVALSQARAALELTAPGLRIQFKAGMADEAPVRPALSELLHQPKPAVDSPRILAPETPVVPTAAGQTSTLAGLPAPGGQGLPAPNATGLPTPNAQGLPAPNAQAVAPAQPRETALPTTAAETAMALAAPGAVSAVRVAAVTPQEAPPPVAHTSLAAQVDGSIKWLIKNQDPGAELQLHPESLGTVQIKLRMEGTEVHARIWASDPAAVPILQDHRAFLEASLKQQGLHLGSFDLQQGRQGEQSLPTPAATPAQPFRALEIGQETPMTPAPSLADAHRIEIVA